MLQFFASNLNTLLASYGYLAVLVLVGIESIGIPLPGETILITAAIYAGTTHRLSIVLVIASAAAGSIAGAAIGYAIGRTGGYRLVRRYGRSIRLDEQRLRLGQYLFRQQGGKVVFFGRFVAVLRAFAAFLAGVNLMPVRPFLAFTGAGAIVWASIYGVAAYLLGRELVALSGPVDIGLALVVAVVVMLVIVLLRRNEARLQWEADRSIPDRLEAPR